MNIQGEICLLNDSFPPLIDGVATTVVNYASVMAKEGQQVCVVVPDTPGCNDSIFPYPVIRYPSIDLRKQIGYAAGNPFSAATLMRLKSRDITLLHSHCPIASTFVARELKSLYDVPFVLTYHSRFDIDIASLCKSDLVQQGIIRALVGNVSTCDELWTVSEGAGKSLCKIGYKGDYIVMPNGVDLPRQRADAQWIHQVCGGYDLPEGLPVFLFVGRLMWYKGIRVILDALSGLKSQDYDFRMVFVGGGGNEEEIKDYCKKMGLEKQCIFTGVLSDRALLPAWYTRANLLLFPSSYDTNGLVVREAAACSLASVLLKGSCAAEGITHMQNGILIDETPQSLAVALVRAMSEKGLMRRLGENAAAQLYFSWDDSVHAAMERYQIVLDNYRSGKYAKKKNLGDGLLDTYVNLADLVNQFEKTFK